MPGFDQLCNCGDVFLAQIIAQIVSQTRVTQTAQRFFLKLANAFLGQAKLYPQRLQRAGLVAQPTLGDDKAFAGT